MAGPSAKGAPGSLNDGWRSQREDEDKTMSAVPNNRTTMRDWLVR